MTIHHPPTLINAYLADKVNTHFGDGTTLRFFPTMPTDLNDLTETFPDGGNRFAVYDRMFKMRRSPLPHIKCEQVLYYFYAMEVEEMIRIQQVVNDFLDGGDESAQDLNAWLRANPQSGSDSVFFHNLKVYQLEETRDIIDFGTARTWAGNKIIVDYDWHKG